MCYSIVELSEWLKVELDKHQRGFSFALNYHVVI